MSVALEAPIVSAESMGLVRTANGTRLHIAPCPHILGAAASDATAADLFALPLCSWCEAEVDGAGRTYFDSLDDAMRFFGAHVGSKALVRDALRFVTHDRIWVPNSRSYIALGLEGATVAWVGKTYVVPLRGWIVELPGYAPHARDGSARGGRFGDPCPTHFIARSLTGVCDPCE